MELKQYVKKVKKILREKEAQKQKKREYARAYRQKK